MYRAKWISALVGCAGMLSAASAQAADCSSLPNPIYVGGSTAVQPLIALMGKALAAANATDTIVYINKGSCVGAGAVVADVTPMGACANGACFTDKGLAVYYKADGSSATCDLDPNGTHLDVGTSDVFVDTCVGLDANLKKNVVDVSAFAQAMAFVVPKKSSQTAITAEEGYFAFGFGPTGGATPWTMDPATFFHIRNGSSGTQNILGYRVGIVPVSKMLGKNEGGSGGVLAGVVADNGTTPEPSIGILAAEYYDARRDMLTSLAFKGFNQTFAYYPDSSSTSFDKKNVRDGHYLPWGYLHMIMQADGNKNPVRANAKKFQDWMLGTTAGPWATGDKDIADVVIAGRGIPLCAMNVSITKEGDDLKWTPPAAPCGCYFEKNVAGGATSCTVCSNSMPCTSGVCRRGYCEAK